MVVEDRSAVNAITKKDLNDLKTKAVEIGVHTDMIDFIDHSVKTPCFRSLIDTYLRLCRSS
jgi:hypothetical protein